MVKLLKNWLARYFSDEDAIIFGILLLTGILIIIFLGKMLAPFFSGLIIAFLLQGGVSLFRKTGLPHLPAVIITFTLFIALFSFILLFFMPLLWKQVMALVNEFPGMLKSGQSIMASLPEKYPYWISREQINNFIVLVNTQMANFGQWVLSFSLSRLPVLMSVLIYCILVPILVFFFLKDQSLLMGWLSSILPKERRVLNQVKAEMSEQIANYIRGKVMEIAVVGLTTFTAFAWIELRYAALLALLVGLSVLIPYIGAALVTIPVILIGFLQWGWSNEFMVLMVVYGVIQALDGNVLVPLLFSEVVNLHPIAIIVSVLLFGGLWGFWGIFFAIPLATLVKAILNAWPRTDKSHLSDSS